MWRRPGWSVSILDPLPGRGDQQPGAALLAGALAGGAFNVVALTVDGPLTGAAALVPWLASALIGTVLIEQWRRRLAAAH